MSWGKHFMNRKTNTLISLLLSFVVVFATVGSAFAEDTSSVDSSQPANLSTSDEGLNEGDNISDVGNDEETEEQLPPIENTKPDNTLGSDGTTPEDEIPTPEEEPKSEEEEDDGLIALLAAIDELTEEADAIAEFDGYIVKVKEDEVTEEMIEAAPSELIADSIFLVESPEEVLDFADPEEIEYIEPNYRVYLLDFPETAPDDPNYAGSQWNLKSGYGINAPGMWQKGLTGAGSRVAVIDSGVNGTHQDWNPGTILAGYDFTNNKNPSASNPNIVAGTNSDDVGHGTVVTSIIAASTNNSKNIAGIAYGTKIVPMKVLSNLGGNILDVIKALDIVYALNSDSNPGNDISVVNMSIGTDGKNTDLQTAINKIVAQGTVVVAAVGNGWPSNNPTSYTTILYPAGCDNVIGVAATDKNGSRAYYSQYNSTVDIAAPGGIGTGDGSIVGLYYGNTTNSTAGQGTSFAAPHVAAMAAAAKGRNKSFSPAQILSLIQTTASIPSTDPGNTSYYGAGIANAAAFANAIEALYSDITISATVSSNERTVALRAEDIELLGSVTQVQFAVWGEAGGQNDLYWYNGTKGSGAIWTSTADISRHKESGKYQVHVYATINGQTVFVGSNTFNITANTATGLSYTKVSSGVWQVTLSGVSAVSGVSKIELATWSDKNNQDDLSWPIMTQTTPGTYSVIIRASDHKYDAGLYNTHAYLTSSNGIRSLVRIGSFEMDTPEVEISATVSSNERTVALYTENVGLLGSVTQVQFAVWGETGGQNDLYWYNSTKGSGDIWNATVDISRHKESGKYQAHVYATINGKLVLVGTKTFNITANIASGLSYTKVSPGVWQVTLSGVSAVSGISKVELATWSDTDGQDDLAWPVMTQTGPGTYTVTIKASDHKFDEGTYYTHAYLTSGNGINNLVRAGSFKMDIPDVGASANVSSNERTVALSAENVGLFGSATQVRFAVWGETGGQNDLYWYNGTKSSGDLWTSTVDISRHKESGKYQVHVYATINGQAIFIGSKTFNITANTATGLSYTKVSPGIWQVTLSGVSAVSGISKVELATWSDKDGQDDLAWPVMTQTGPGTYTVTIKASDHKFDEGTYYTHAYLTSGNGIKNLVRAGSFEMDLPPLMLSATVSSNERTVALSAENVGLFGAVTQVQFAVWGEIGGQNDLYWYNASKGAGDIWNATVDISRHKESGRYQAHAYATINGQTIFVGSETFNITANTATTLTSTRQADGAYTSSLSGISAPTGVAKVEMAVWSTKNGQDDLAWYEAPVTPDGSFAASLIFHNHKNETGEYNIHAYVTSGNGVRNLVKNIIFNVEAAPIQKSVSVSTDESLVQLTIKYPCFNNGHINSIRFAVWSEVNGQDDLYWYTGTRSGDTWNISFNPSQHKSIGKFYVHPYATTSENQSMLILEGAMEFNITKIFSAPWKGIDISYAQGSINWSAVKASGIDFAIIRAGYIGMVSPKGYQNLYYDDDFVNNVRAAKAAGLYVGTYLYVYSRDEAEQAIGISSFNAFVRNNGLTFDLPVYLDIEDSTFYLPSTNALGGYTYRTNMLRSGLNQLQGYGYKPGFYTYLNWAQTQFDTQQLINEGYSFWLARYYNNNAELDPYTRTWNNGFPDIWQYRSTGRVPGISGNVDMNYLYPDKNIW